MEQFAAVAVAHFISLLIPGVDFFLIARTAMTSGWRTATGVCLGIASANGIIITAAFSGLSFISDPTLLAVIQLLGGGFLVYIGIAFLRSKAHLDAALAPSADRASWRRNFGLGFASGMLNPKNALFYLTLSSMLAGSPSALLVAYGAWMFSIVLVWDVFVAVALGSRQFLTRFSRLVPWLTKASGAFLLVFGIAMIVRIALQLAG